jgi:hypothetical protein
LVKAVPAKLNQVTYGIPPDLNEAAENPETLQARMKSLPVLTKQTSGNMPVSARDKN